MTEFANHLLFGIYPYIALSVLVLGSVIRYDREPYSWRSGSSQLLRRRQLMLGSILFHVGVLVIFFGHLGGLLTPIWIFEALGIAHSDKQLLAVLVGGVAGVLGFLGATVLLHRRLTDGRIRKTSSLGDILILVLLWLQLALGLATIPVSITHLDGAEMVRFMAWAQGIFSFDGAAADQLRGTSPLFRLHITLGLTILLLFPFTRLVHMLSAPVRYVFRPGYQIVRSRRMAARHG